MFSREALHRIFAERRKPKEQLDYKIMNNQEDWNEIIEDKNLDVVDIMN
jgi:hypothetical protein